jgi:hypothetical protein
MAAVEQRDGVPAHLHHRHHRQQVALTPTKHLRRQGVQ